ncbi:MAG: hypothetical protein NC048_04575 [Bacteroides sp.]|nr:hypothetical protein [Ruminococcus flavefaciens]MCM1554750.1 hypothetical protein [Bacteroides sp.]
MDKILNTLYLKVKSETKTLTNSAIAQILVKIIYSNENRLPFETIVSLYKKFTGRKSVNENIIRDVLSTLCATNEIKLSTKNEYYITDLKRKQIDSTCESSKKRRKNIIDTFFSQVHSEREAIEIWLQDVSMHFFQFFSNEWISDLMETKSSIINNKDSIRDVIVKRTKDIKKIDKRDQDILPKLFFEFLCSKDADVVAYLWEYGTSAFSAKLISNTVGVDTLTLDVFKGSKCLFDTNILIFAKLDASKYHKALISLEKSFNNLGIEIGILHITKEEYLHKIDVQRNITLNNIEKMGYDLTATAEDDFTQSAIALHCRKKEDFETFFDDLNVLPPYLHKSLPIRIVDNKQIADAIDYAQKDEKKKKKLNSIFSSATGREKRPAPLRHDVGLIAGAESLRSNEKWFILSEEISVNEYSKQKPVENGLPLSIRVGTLINVLALDSGGDCFDANDYMPLFASIIQNGFQPSKATFAQEDLYAIYDLNHQIALLPDEQKRDIVMNIHAKRLKGENEETLKIELERAITRGKLQISNDLNETQKALTATEEEVKRQKSRGDIATQALLSQIQKDVKRSYRKKLWTWILIPVGIPLVVWGILFFLPITLNLNVSSQLVNPIMNIITGIVPDLIYLLLGGARKIRSIFKNKNRFFEEEIEKRMEKALDEQTKYKK